MEYSLHFFSRLKDGIHYGPLPVRFVSNLILTHICKYVFVFATLRNSYFFAQGVKLIKKKTRRRYIVAIFSSDYSNYEVKRIHYICICSAPLTIVYEYHFKFLFRSRTYLTKCPLLLISKLGIFRNLDIFFCIVTSVSRMKFKLIIIILVQ